jgi:hypothetical protein
VWHLIHPYTKLDYLSNFPVRVLQSISKADELSRYGNFAHEKVSTEDGLKHQWVGFEEGFRLVKGSKPTSEFAKSDKEPDFSFVDTDLKESDNNN